MSEAASPLPGAPLARRVLDHPPIDGARIKERPGDFLVEELPAAEPSGEGDHLWLRIVKEGVHHQELVRVLCGHFGVGPQAIGWAGMKDRHAVTSQTVSVHLPRRPDVRSIQDDRVQVLWATWNGTKLRRGDLSGNRFSVRVRGIEPFRAPAAWRAVRELEARGVPNGFGPQRFGMHGNNHTMGALLLAGRADDVARELARTGEPYRDLRAVPEPTKELWVDAWQSAIFNRVLDARIAAGTYDRVLAGDIACGADGTGFAVDAASAEGQGDGSLAARAARLEVSATGPMPGAAVPLADGAPGELERAVIEEFGGRALLEPMPRAWRRPPGDRRPLRIALRNPEMESGFDEHGPYVRVAFDLPAGAYATVALREAFGDGLVDASRDAARS
jgi:tRNA pseudouridine13 synthase